MWAVFAAHIGARLAYVGYVWVGLTRQQSDGWWTRRWGLEPGFARFRRGASLVMTIDAVSFVAVCLVGWGTAPAVLPRAVAIAIGAVLVLLGVGTKLWAAATLGHKAYYWYNFFTPAAPVTRVSTGPYRFLKNPMYTVGYLQTYGCALITGSLAGVVASVCDQVAILVFHWRVESAHFKRMTGRAA
ncbi:MAG TPA: PEMT/PEM2 methyltransferase family protein [Gemmatimonadales bacterium]|nr:PEMT/PEM2 methyltransferase family protein [Gemmatimonadales bacterium]